MQRISPLTLPSPPLGREDKGEGASGEPVIVSLFMRIPIRGEREDITRVKNLSLTRWEGAPFGAEYAWRPRWGLLERSYVRMLGLLDFPSRLRARVVTAELDVLKFQKVLDLGSGTGCYSFYLSRQRDIDVSAVEIDERRISESFYIAECLGRKNLKFHFGSAHECLQKFPSETFEMALAIEVLQYLADAPLILQETYRVLKPGGYLLGHVPVFGYLRSQERTLFNDDGIRQMLSGARFQIIKIMPTLGGIPQKFCALYQRLNRSRFLMGIMFPLILIASFLFQVENPKGKYRFFIGRKPIGSEEQELRSLEERAALGAA